MHIWRSVFFMVFIFNDRYGPNYFMQYKLQWHIVLLPNCQRADLEPLILSNFEFINCLFQEERAKKKMNATETDRKHLPPSLAFYIWSATYLASISHSQRTWFVRSYRFWTGAKNDSSASEYAAVVFSTSIRTRMEPVANIAVWDRKPAAV